MKRELAGKFFVACISIVLAFSLWLYVSLEIEDVMSVQAKLDLVNAPPHVDLDETSITNRSGQRIHRVKLRVAGTKRELSQLYDSDFTVGIDLTGRAEAEGKFVHRIKQTDVVVRTPQVPQLRVRDIVRDISPEEIYVELRFHKKQVGIVAVVEGEPAPGYKVVEPIIVVPETIEVVGAPGDYESATQLLTMPVSIHNAKETHKGHYPLDFAGRPLKTLFGGRLREPDEPVVGVTVNVRPNIVRGKIYNVPLRIEGVRPGFQLEWDTSITLAVTVEGLENDVRTVTAKDIEATIAFTDRRPGRYNLTPKVEPILAFRNKVQIVELRPLTIDFLLVEEVTDTPTPTVTPIPTPGPTATPTDTPAEISVAPLPEPAAEPAEAIMAPLPEPATRPSPQD